MRRSVPLGALAALAAWLEIVAARRLGAGREATLAMWG